MKLRFKLLMIDDNPDSIREAIGGLNEYLDDRGFTLVIQDPQNFSKLRLAGELRSKGKDVDPVLVDFNLGQQNFDGTIAAQSVSEVVLIHRTVRGLI